MEHIGQPKSCLPEETSVTRGDPMKDFKLAQAFLDLESTREKRNVARTILAARTVANADKMRQRLGLPSIFTEVK